MPLEVWGRFLRGTRGLNDWWGGHLLQKGHHRQRRRCKQLVQDGKENCLVQQVLTNEY